MRIKRIEAQDAKRFKHLIIDELPETARLVVLVGQNGCGKSSIFDTFRSWHNNNGFNLGFDPSYHVRIGGSHIKPDIEFHSDHPEDKRKIFYLRSAYRNEPDFTIDNLPKQNSPFEIPTVVRMIDNDVAVSHNYKAMIGQSVEIFFSPHVANSTPIGTLRDQLVGQLQTSLKNVLPELELVRPGNPLREGSFLFSKGTSKNFHYKNLSGGEKSAFDLIADLVLKVRHFDDTIFCIDEPDTHMHTRLQANLLRELYSLIPLNSQLWISTHSIGMMNAAVKLSQENPGSVCFLDLHDLDFDEAKTLKPSVPNRAFWKKALSVALDDIAGLVAPTQIVLCEGQFKGTADKAELDADCLRKIFAKEFPDTDFISVGSNDEVKRSTNPANIGAAILTIAPGTRIIRVIDRDDMSGTEIAEYNDKGIRVLSKRQIESYLWDDEVLEALCKSEGKVEMFAQLQERKKIAFQSVIAGNKPADDMKAASGDIYLAAKQLLNLTACGNTKDAMMRLVLAPLVTTEMSIYKQLRNDIFDS